MAKTKDINTEKRIKAAATKIFTAKGLAGARMQDIADAAQVNKALVHYYFRSKKQLFELIFEEKMFKLFGALSLIVLSDTDFEGKIRQFVSAEIDIISEFPQMPLFVLNELQQDPDIIRKNIKDKPLNAIRQQLRAVFQKEVKQGNIRDNLPFEQFIVNLISMCIFPFMARPMIQFILEMDDPAYQKMIEQRKTLIADLILNDLRKK